MTTSGRVDVHNATSWSVYDDQRGYIIMIVLRLSNSCPLPNRNHIWSKPGAPSRVIEIDSHETDDVDVSSTHFDWRELD